MYDKNNIYTEKTLNIFKEYLIWADGVVVKDTPVEVAGNSTNVEGNKIFEALNKYSLSEDGGYVLRVLFTVGTNLTEVSDSWRVVNGEATYSGSDWKTIEKIEEELKNDNHEKSFNNGAKDSLIFFEVNNGKENIVFGWSIVGNNISPLESSSMVKSLFPNKYKMIKTLHEREYTPGFKISL